MLRERIEQACAERGLLYRWWVPTTSYVGQLAIVVVALAMRDALWPLHPLALVLVLVVFPPVYEIAGGRPLHWWIDPLGPFVAGILLLTVPPTSELDAAPLIFGLLTAQALARDGVTPGLVVGLLGTLTLVLTPLRPEAPLLAVHLLDVPLGLLIGAMLRAQMRALVAEREARARAWEQATTAERERIAREIHDLVAHSLSVTLLHVTGARHALRDVADAGPGAGREAVAEVDAALADAEQVGRRAMADIRRTVSAMAGGDAAAGTRRPLPGAADIAELARQTSLAGLVVEYDERGDPGTLPAAAGLGLYRIAQESLANVAKHAPGSSARMQLSVGRGCAHLRVVNRLDGAPRRTPEGAGGSGGQGSGLAGMQARAQQLGADLTAGQSGDEWVVDVRFGSGARAIDLPCGQKIPLSSRATEVAG